ncbi:bifunctional riboflavin kinase/FAD synthetase [Helicobacter sp. MIT 14-3879]|uniref:bifunctional riboflavin kinase/FAD synthetase n=1 Tax=Helicobacter sp. MIT 14-3879 TaxID=2040649 RepID=UPI000E1EF29D|nr:bifunctional riboflavin kinase/FAD synthetase [Helicobacter sp. MIT 14-3879]RDU60581.1 bifunctional riboflavin kinase/FAD synthetase [Helicobacter sp. MIT 14-3879]
MKSFLSFANSKLPYDSIAIGKFDAMHKAHLKLLDLVGDNGLALSITQVYPPFITPPKERETYSRVPFYGLRFDVIKSYSSLEFLTLLFTILPHLQKIVVGYDFCFGANRISSTSDIKPLLNVMGKTQVEVVILESQKFNGMPIHTSIIKELIKYGDIVNANIMLHRFYTIKGLVIAGQGIGKKQLYPTINIATTLYLLPQYGVYAGFCYLRTSIYKSVIFVGNRLSTDKQFCIECHIIEESAIEVSRRESIKIGFVERIRNNQKFEKLEDLKAQIAQDIHKAKQLLSNIDS